MNMTDQQKLDFRRDGYIKIDGAVGRAMFQNARQAMNHSMGQEGLHEAKPESYRAAAFCEELKSAQVLTDIFNGEPVKSAAECLMGTGNVQNVTNAKIAMRFPGAPGQDAGPPQGHLDGLGSGTNGMPKGVYRRGFSMLAVSYLADVSEPYCGNFTVWPGSHLFFQNYFMDHGHEVLAEGMPRVDVGIEPVQITGHAGGLSWPIT